MPWRKNVDPIIKEYLDLQVKESNKFKNAFSKAKNPANAQMWIAIANLSKHIFNLELKLKYLEGTIKDLNERLLKSTEKKPEDVLKELEKEAKQFKKKTANKKVKGSLRKTLKKF
jgi:lipid II:glycine glycyltransferase (peptidoglycan interpeptide bridge formation enzyme)